MIGSLCVSFVRVQKLSGGHLIELASVLTGFCVRLVASPSSCSFQHACNVQRWAHLPHSRATQLFQPWHLHHASATSLADVMWDCEIGTRNTYGFPFAKLKGSAFRVTLTSTCGSARLRSLFPVNLQVPRSRSSTYHQRRLHAQALLIQALPAHLPSQPIPQVLQQKVTGQLYSLSCIVVLPSR